MTLSNSRILKPVAAIAVGAALCAAILWKIAPATAGTGVTVPPAEMSLQGNADQPQTVVLAGGCYWGMEEVFQHVKGVTDVVTGYAGGTREHANYGDSSSGRYGDAEAVRISYDPRKISYTDLLQIYFSVAHDPTQVNRQGPDVGPQYRSEIFAAGDGQARVARAYIQQLDKAHVFDAPIATKVGEHQNFFEAEAYMQDYARRHPNSLYIMINDAPKVAALKARFPQRYHDD
ncbi:MAG: peptide-methionine (S)-S-oxide reductase MsrA [Arenicellales bacterium]